MNRLSHGGEDLLLRHAAGELDAGFSLLVETHLAMSADSRRLHAQFEALGGALLDDIAPADVDPAALNRALSAIDDERARSGNREKALALRSSDDAQGFALPAPLAAIEHPRLALDRAGGPFRACRFAGGLRVARVCSGDRAGRDGAAARARRATRRPACCGAVSATAPRISAPATSRRSTRESSTTL